MESLMRHSLSSISESPENLQSESQKGLFERLMQTSAALLSSHKRGEILRTILQGVKESGFDRVRLFLLSPDGKILHGVAQVGMKEERFTGISWSAVDDYRFQVARQEQSPHIFRPDPNHPDPVEKEFDKTDVAEWVILPLVLRGEVIGHIAADNKFSRRPINEDELKPLALFAMQAAATIEKSELTARDERKLELFAKLAQATTEIVGQIGKLELPELLTLVAKHATEILSAEVCSVFLCKREGVLTLEASHGHRQNSFERGLELAIRTGTKTGLTGHIAYEGKLVNLNGPELLNHIAVRKPENSFTTSGICHSVLATPLNQKHTRAGLLKANNKKDESGFAHPMVAFTKEDEWIITIFAEVIVVCLESATLVEHKQLLIGSLPHAVIAIDRKGNVTEFNHEAEQILGYTASEVLGRKVSQLYYDPKEPKFIGAKLDKSANGKINGYQTLIRTKTGQSVPISLSAYLLYDQQQCSGSVGIFEDQRKLHNYKERLELTLYAIQTVAEAETLKAGLQRLAERLVARFPGAYCGFLLLNEDETCLIEQAADYGQRRQDSPLGQLKNPKQIALSDFPGLVELLQAGRPIRLRNNSDPLTYANLNKMNEEHGFDPPIQSLLVLPIKLDSRVLGVLNLAEICSEDQSQFSRQHQENVDLAVAIATQSANLIDRMQANAQEGTRQRQIRQAARALASVTSLSETTDQILTSACELLKADKAIFGFFDHLNNTLVHRFSKATGINEEIWEQYRDRNDDNHITARLLLEERHPVFIQDVTDPKENKVLDSVTKEALKQVGVKSLLAIPLRIEEERLGLVCVLYQQPYGFNKKEHHRASSFARYAALALKKAKLFEQLNKTSEAATVIANITVLGHRQATLDAIVEKVSKATECEAVVLFEHDREKQRMLKSSVFGLLPTEHTLNLDQDKEHPLVYELLNTEESHRVVQVTGNSNYEKRSFAINQQIKTFVAFPLQTAGRRVGVLFLNFRKERSFTAEELETMQLFANQAALAIHYAQSTEADERKRRELEALERLSDQLRQAQNLQEMIDSTVELAAKELDTDYCNLILPDRNSQLHLRAQYGWPQKLEPFFLQHGTGSQAGFTIETGKPILVDDYATESRFTVTEQLKARKVKSGISVPMFRDQQIVGALLVFTLQQRHFTEEQVRFLGLIANHAAMAMRGMERYEDLQRRDRHMLAVHNSSEAILKSFGDEQKVLDQIIKEAVESVSSVTGPKAVMGTLQLYDAERNELTVSSIYPPASSSLLLARVDKGRWSLDKTKARFGQIGVTGRAIQEGRSQLVNDLSKDRDYIEYNKDSKSELSVLLKDDGKIIGAINVESDQLYGFDENDQFALELLADHAVIAMKLAQTYKDLRRTKGLVGSRTAMAWMNMANNTWRHTVAGDAATLTNRVTLIRGYLEEGQVTDERVYRHLKQIEELAKNIQERPVTPPLSSEEGVVPTNLNSLVTERLRQLQENCKYENIKLVADTQPEPLIVNASSEWLRRALDILTDNSARAVCSITPVTQSRLAVTVSTRLNGKWAELRVTDRGPGIPNDVLDNFLVGEIKSAKGQGVGLLIAQAIVETYGGQIELARTDSTGTEMLIRLPHLL